MPKQISNKCVDCGKIIRKNQKLLNCSQCLQFKRIKCPGRKDQNNPKTNSSTTTDWRCIHCDFSFPFASCSKVEFADIFNPTVPCYDKHDKTHNAHAHNINLLFNNIINSYKTAKIDIDHDSISEEDPHINLPNCTFHSNPRSKYRGGGVAFHIRVDVESTHRADLDIMNEKIFESIFINIKFQDKVTTCGNIHRFPGNTGNVQKMFLTNLEDILRKINKRESFLLGDFNYNNVDCDEPNVTKFTDVMHDHGFSFLINRPKRIIDTISTLFDQIWTKSNTPQKVQSCIITFSISDHLATMMCIAINNCKSSKAGTEYYRQFSDSKIESFSTSLS